MATPWFRNLPIGKLGQRPDEPISFPDPALECSVSSVNGQSGAALVEQMLYDRGVSTVFCITGAGNIALVDALLKRARIKVVYSHHEQAAVMEAQGYSRVSGKPGVAIVTTGGGTSNALTGILSAHLDSIPVIVLSGNESSFNCSQMRDFRAYGVQGFNSVSSIKPVCKESSRVMNPDELRYEFDRLWSAMVSGRSGPVHLDIPMDVQRRLVTSVSIPPVNQTVTSNDAHQIISAESLETIRQCAVAVREAKRPLFYFGNGIRGDFPLSELQAKMTAHRFPYILSWSALDFFSTREPLNIGRAGIYGDRAANLILQQCDVLVTVGTRLAIPQVGYDLSDFARRARRFTVDIDPVELRKFSKFDWTTINVSASQFLTLLFKELTPSVVTDKNWLSRIQYVRERVPQTGQTGPSVEDEESEFVHSFHVIKAISRHLSPNAVIVTDVGAGLLTGHFALDVSGGQRVFTSQGLGEMGFGLPGAIGAYFGDESRPIICLNTDGGIMFNLQELQVVKHHQIPIKLFVFNNNGYTMIKSSQENLFDGRIAGVSPETGISFPDFQKLAQLFDLEYVRMSDSSRVDEVCQSVMSSEAAQLIDVVMSPKQKYFPRLATSKGEGGALLSPPLEDLDPKISLADLEDLLGYTPHVNSRSATR